MMGVLISLLVGWDFSLTEAEHFLYLGAPAYYTPAQLAVAEDIIKEANRQGADPHFLVSVAWAESRLQTDAASATGDVGVFQINWHWWGKRQWGYTSFADFRRDMHNITHATRAATRVLTNLRTYKACQGKNLAACYNGGPGWRRSKNLAAIQAYRKKVNRTYAFFKIRFPEWLTLK